MRGPIVPAVVEAKEKYRHNGKWVKRIVFSADCWERLKAELRVITTYAFAEGSGPKPGAPDAEWMKIAGHVFCVTEIEVWHDLPGNADFACEARNFYERTPWYV